MQWRHQLHERETCLAVKEILLQLQIFGVHPLLLSFLLQIGPGFEHEFVDLHAEVADFFAACAPPKAENQPGSSGENASKRASLTFDALVDRIDLVSRGA
eukprot:scaffold1616_cov310-Pinguiococcus_pyrenoidosus.AAC.25